MKNLNRLSGLQVVFNNSGKNPYGHDIQECLTALRRMKVLNVITALSFVAGALVAFIGFAFVCIKGVSIYNAFSFGAGLVCVAVSIKLMQTEHGENLISVATEWLLLNRRLKQLGIKLSGMQSGHQVASVFETRLVQVVKEKISAEKAGTPKKLKETERLFNQIRGLALELKFEVSDREDFFRGRGEVRFTQIITLRPAPVV
jgi:hypothetical protein